MTDTEMRGDQPETIKGLTKADAWNLLELVELAQQQEVYKVDDELHQKLIDTVYEQDIDRS